MPVVKGKHFAYTQKGRKAAAKHSAAKPRKTIKLRPKGAGRAGRRA